MHEHISEQLVNAKPGCFEEVKSKDVIDIDTRQLEHLIGNISQNINYQKVFGNCGNASHQSMGFRG
jgi:hypothetical protein